jgi:coatomer subunit beta
LTPLQLASLELPIMATFLENAYSLVHQDNTADQPSLQDLRTQLEKGTDESKVETMKRVLTIMLNGDPMPQLLMHIIRFVMPSKSKALKKLLYLYYEICPKLDASGKLKQEMILVWYTTALYVKLLHMIRLTIE